MGLTPTLYNEILTEPDYDITFYPSKTYYMNFTQCRIIGNTDKLEAMVQAIFKVLNTERSTCLAYSDNYGIELLDLYGKSSNYVIPELERRIKEALEWDSRIDLVDNFEFELKGSSVTATFTVHTNYGDVEAERTVEI